MIGGVKMKKIKTVIPIPEDVKKNITLLNNSGFEAYVVGGAVRDSLLKIKASFRNLEPKDWDISTNANPEDVHNVFKNHQVIDTGLKHGTVSVIVNNKPYEITTYRKDGKYTDGRHPDKVYFTNSLVDDLSRRDITINAMAYHPKKGLIDPFNGRSDLDKGVIRCVGYPFDRLREDALRILRVLRFSAQFGFSIEENTQRAVIKCRHFLKNNVSAERILCELTKMLVAKNFLSVFANMKVLPVIFCVLPELKATVGFEQHNPYHTKDVYGHIIQATNYANPTFLQRMTLLLHDIAKPQCFSLDEQNIGHFYRHAEMSADMANEILFRLKTDRRTREMIVSLIKHHDIQFTPNQRFVNRMLNKLGEEVFRELIAVKKADILAQSGKFLTSRLNDLLEIENIIEKTISSEHCFSLRDLKINGTDIMKLGISQGKMVGETLSYLLAEVIEERLENDKGVLRTEAKKFLEQNVMATAT